MPRTTTTCVYSVEWGKDAQYTVYSVQWGKDAIDRQLIHLHASCLLKQLQEAGKKRSFQHLKLFVQLTIKINTDGHKLVHGDKLR